MTTVSDIYSFIDGFAPFSTQATWDNSGLLLGDGQRKVNKALICLDLTKSAALYAAENGCELIVSHHPVIFRALKAIDADSVFFPLIKHDICVISAHTNLDKAPGGVNDTLCAVLGLDYLKCGDEFGDGFLNICTFNKATQPNDAAELLKHRLGGHVRFIDGCKPITRAAVCAGAGGEYYKEAAFAGCEALITGDADHHDFLDAAALGVTLLAAGHYETEYPIVPVLAQKLTDRFPDIDFLRFPQNNTIRTI